MAHGLEQKILELARPVAESLGLAVWGLELAAAGRRPLIRLYIESEGGSTVDQCAEVSRSLGAALDVEDVMRGAYVLEVSSPGLERRIFEAAQLPPYVGRILDLSLGEPEDGRKNFRGRLDEARPDGLVMTVDGKRFEFSWDRVKKARLVHEF